MILCAAVECHRSGRRIETQASHWLGAEGGRAIRAILDHTVQQKGGLLASIISGIVVILSVGGVFAEIQQAMNRIWNLRVKQGQAIKEYLRARIWSVIVLSVAAIILIGSVIVAGWVQGWTAQMGAGWKFASWAADVLANLIALTLIFALVFRTVPDAQIGWRTTWVGAVITAILFLVGKYGLALYFRYSAPASAFGALGSLAAVLIWIYYSAQIVLFGAAFTQVFSNIREQGVRPSKHAEFLAECDETKSSTPDNKPLRSQQQDEWDAHSRSASTEVFQ